jgi:hypothetical protein
LQLIRKGIGIIRIKWRIKYNMMNLKLNLGFASIYNLISGHQIYNDGNATAGIIFLVLSLFFFLAMNFVDAGSEN